MRLKIGAPSGAGEGFGCLFMGLGLAFVILALGIVAQGYLPMLLELLKK